MAIKIEVLRELIRLLEQESQRDSFERHLGLDRAGTEIGPALRQTIDRFYEAIASWSVQEAYEKLRGNLALSNLYEFAERWPALATALANRPPEPEPPQASAKPERRLPGVSHTQLAAQALQRASATLRSAFLHHHEGRPDAAKAAFQDADRLANQAELHWQRAQRADEGDDQTLDLPFPIDFISMEIHNQHRTLFGEELLPGIPLFSPFPNEGPVLTAAIAKALLETIRKDADGDTGFKNYLLNRPGGPALEPKLQDFFLYLALISEAAIEPTFENLPEYQQLLHFLSVYALTKLAGGRPDRIIPLAWQAMSLRGEPAHDPWTALNAESARLAERAVQLEERKRTLIQAGSAEGAAQAIQEHLMAIASFFSRIEALQMREISAEGGRQAAALAGLHRPTLKKLQDEQAGLRKLASLEARLSDRINEELKAESTAKTVAHLGRSAQLIAREAAALGELWIQQDAPEHAKKWFKTAANYFGRAGYLCDKAVYGVKAAELTGWPALFYREGIEEIRRFEQRYQALFNGENLRNLDALGSIPASMIENRRFDDSPQAPSFESGQNPWLTGGVLGNTGGIKIKNSLTSFEGLSSPQWAPSTPFWIRPKITETEQPPTLGNLAVHPRFLEGSAVSRNFTNHARRFAPTPAHARHFGSSGRRNARPGRHGAHVMTRSPFRR